MPLVTQAWRLAMLGDGFKRHDSRCLALSHGQLLIYQKGSSTAVKDAIDVKCAVDECQLITDNTISVFLRRKPRNMFCGSDHREVHKVYFFEFCSEKLATDFHEEVRRLKQP